MLRLSEIYLVNRVIPEFTHAPGLAPRFGSPGWKDNRYQEGVTLGVPAPGIPASTFSNTAIVKPPERNRRKGPDYTPTTMEDDIVITGNKVRKFEADYPGARQPSIPPEFRGYTEPCPDSDTPFVRQGLITDKFITPGF